MSAATEADGLTIEAPESVDAPLTVWDIAFESARSAPGESIPDFVNEVSVTFQVPRSGDVVLAIAGPGIFAPVTGTRFDNVSRGSSVTSRWRWAAPLRAQPPPYDMNVAATATFGPPGDRRSVTASRAVTVEPPPAPEDDVYVSDMEFSWATNGYGPLERDAANGELDPGDGGPIRLDGDTYEKGIGTNARSLVGVYLGGNCTRFSAVVGIDDVRGGAGSAQFRVVGDGDVLYESPVITGSSPAERVSVNVTGIQQLDLIADPTPDGQGNDGANWADARLECGQ
ncbi:hypothetical protein EF847_10770 [Actinobacteria bacterium YIM 96077]|uniref:Glycosyl hydrolase family 98 putative carbohydrate-binding module domain-containing protein n=1 Tax=Phytoactinopolyspora halophila TaxID=1981511 RepID=A0A329QGQ0_9ACTN|nr:NPCBM/NEW2 domain-containing protein [Phytoactinopolyspora halophila]AYY13109.1 hypothetical protein EF847_10770 [Actinobacteria bacterium YIM 96077]RAW11121.1 hypothetical protein DPM12_17415 [Phytoactinopolyspora halophila]